MNIYLSIDKKEEIKSMIPPCIDVVIGNTTSIVAFTNTFACDKFSVPHVVASFLVAIITRNAWFGFTMAGIHKVLEYLIYAISGDFTLFATGIESDNLENIANILLEDWLIQSGVGALILGGVFLYVFPGKAHLTLDDLKRRNRIIRFIFYTIMTLFLIAPALLYPLVSGSFQYGVLLYPFIQLVFILIIWFYEKEFRKENFQTEFWFTFWFFSLVINFSNLFDYFYSGPIQSWFISTLFLYYLFLRRVFCAPTKPLNRT